VISMPAIELDVLEDSCSKYVPALLHSIYNSRQILD
jgi:hypothetical protein